MTPVYDKDQILHYFQVSEFSIMTFIEKIQMGRVVSRADKRMREILEILSCLLHQPGKYQMQQKVVELPSRKNGESHAAQGAGSAGW